MQDDAFWPSEVKILNFLKSKMADSRHLENFNKRPYVWNGLTDLHEPNALRHGSYSLPAYYTMPAFTPQLQSITVLWLVLISTSHGG